MKPTPYLDFILLLTFVIALAHPLWAMEPSYMQGYEPLDLQNNFQEKIEQSMGEKLERGCRNFFFGWYEFPRAITAEVNARKRKGDSAGVGAYTVGVLKGSANTIERRAVGLYEIVTFSVPQKPILSEIEDWDTE